MTVPVKKVWKRWREQRRKFVGKWRIHATDHVFEPLREKAFRVVEQNPDIILLSAVQHISAIPVRTDAPYWKKGKLNFDKVYEDMVKSIFDRVQLQAYTAVTVTIDDRKTKEGILGKQKIQEHILAYVTQYYPSTQVTFRFVPSSSEILLEMADFISNSFYKKYTGQEIAALDRLKVKTIVLENPLQ